MAPRREGELIREAVQYIEYGKDNYWTADKMVDHTALAAKMCKLAFPQFRALYAFDNASSHCAFAADALFADRMNLGPRGKQPRMKDSMKSLLRTSPQETMNMLGC